MNIIVKYVQLSFRKMFAYKTNAVAIIIDTFMDCFSIWLFWISMLELDVNLTCWNENQLMIFIGFSLISRSITSLFSGSWDVQANILNGTLDNYLIKPGNTLIMIVLEKANFLRITISFISGLAIIIIISGFSHFIYFISAIVLCILSATTLQLIILGIYELSFFLNKMDETVEISNAIFSISEYPIIFFGNKVLWFFTYIIPVVYIGTVPVEMITSKKVPKSIFEFSFLLILILLIDMFIWKKGRQKYESTN